MYSLRSRLLNQFIIPGNKYILYQSIRYTGNIPGKSILHDSSQGSIITGTAHTTTPPSYNESIVSQQSAPDIISQYTQPHRPSAMEYISRVPVIYVDSSVAICDGGPGI